MVLQPLEPAPIQHLACEFMVKTRHRKGMSEDVSINKFFDEAMMVEQAQQSADLHWQMIGTILTSTVLEQSSLLEGEIKDFGGGKHLGNSLTCPPLALDTPQRVDTLPASPRRPCYGWISNNEEQGPVHGTKAPFPQDIARFLLRMDGRRKGKTRWDVRPEDM
ncbi:hypothetical protein CMV_011204 [Castanea mollissima]|uniref:Uncharacterized protein n=1 Tax=Castanea mollissima TaxID=60419 RepID=A0A8J4R443_9ROSI|nr:hypothetical protein CMV_011204 [Castanea mollissima]